MSDFFHYAILALIQGVTEFLPISSSAHLILYHQFFSSTENNLLLDIALHSGSLIALIVYSRSTIHNCLISIGKYFTSKKLSPYLILSFKLVWSTMPIIFIGGLFHFTHLIDQLRTPLIIANSTLIFGALLGLAILLYQSSQKADTLTITDISWKQASFMGILQVLSIIPGTSRSGICLTAGLFLKLPYKIAITYSFLMAIPTLLASTSILLLDTITLQSHSLSTIQNYILPFGLSAISSYVSMYFFLALVEKTGLMPYVIYRLLLGITLLYIL